MWQRFSLCVHSELQYKHFGRFCCVFHFRLCCLQFAGRCERCYRTRSRKIIFLCCIINIILLQFKCSDYWFFITFLHFCSKEWLRFLSLLGPGLVFQVYPEAFSSMIHPWGNILAFFFFLNILCLGIDSQVSAQNLMQCLWIFLIFWNILFKS